MNQNRIYIVLTLLLISLSLGGLIYFYRPTTTPTLLEEIVATPTDIPAVVDYPSDQVALETPSLDPTPISDDQSGQSEEQPAGQLEESMPTPTPIINTLTSLQFGFEVPYTSSRKLYEAPENGGTRYTLYSPTGNITVHAGTRWSWSHPGREFTQEFLVSGQPTFFYKINSQTIVDLEVGDTKITVQCVHGGRESGIDECQKFLSDFRLTSGS